MSGLLGRCDNTLVTCKHARIRGIHIMQQIHAGRRKTPRRRERAPIAFVLDAPLRMPREQRQRKPAPEREREAPRTGFERRGCLQVSDEPALRGFERLLDARRDANEIGLANTLQ
jgi:hypothetical protein